MLVHVTLVLIFGGIGNIQHFNLRGTHLRAESGKGKDGLRWQHLKAIVMGMTNSVFNLSTLDKIHAASKPAASPTLVASEVCVCHGTFKKCVNGFDSDISGSWQTFERGRRISNDIGELSQSHSTPWL